jgi:hypothetical protein
MIAIRRDRQGYRCPAPQAGVLVRRNRDGRAFEEAPRRFRTGGPQAFPSVLVRPLSRPFPPFGQWSQKGSSSRPRLLGDLALVRAHNAHQVRFQPAAPLAFGDALEGLDSPRRHVLAAVETGLAEARTNHYAHGFRPLAIGWV